MPFGVHTEFAKTALAGDLALEKITQKPRYTLAAVTAGGTWRFPYNGALSAKVVNRLLQAGAKVSLTKPEPGGIPLVIANARPEVWTKAVEGFEVKPPPAPSAE